jgi:hypothetical protein
VRLRLAVFTGQENLIKDPLLESVANRAKEFAGNWSIKISTEASTSVCNAADRTSSQMEAASHSAVSALNIPMEVVDPAGSNLRVILRHIKQQIFGFPKHFVAPPTLL